MCSQRSFSAGRRRRLSYFLATLFVLTSATWTRADLIVAAQTVAANAGSSNNTLEIALQNTGVAPVNIAGFSFGVSTMGTDITFTLADVNTVVLPYIFAGHSLFGPNISTSPPGHSLTASDVDSNPSGTDVGPASTVGLGRLLFDVAPGAAAGPHTVAITPFPTTSLTDSNGINVPITTLVDGTIIVTAGPQLVPEPASLTSAGVALAAGAWLFVRRRRGQRLL
ncbi:MAG TPA: hypothetical protein VGY66_04055 [Gemmataceae bacterium]|jgi:hypothetical protein|nr:hypothetical protein [Gemmataceae bacterium]